MRSIIVDDVFLSARVVEGAELQVSSPVMVVKVCAGPCGPMRQGRGGRSFFGRAAESGLPCIDRPCGSDSADRPSVVVAGAVAPRKRGQRPSFEREG